MPNSRQPSTFADANAYFNSNPSSIKFKKLDKAIDRSFILINGVIYSVLSRHFDANAVIGEGGEGKVKRVETEQKEIFKVKTQLGTLANHNQDELAFEQQRGDLKGTGERKLTTPKVINNITYDTKTYKVSTYIEGNTLDRTIRTGNLTEVQKLIIAIKLTQAIHDLHHNYDLIHCDLKASNIIVHLPDPLSKNSINLEIIDFGFAKKLPPGHTEVVIHGIKGTKDYIAPEITNHNIYSTASDVYALAQIFKKTFQFTATNHLNIENMQAPFRHYRLTLPEVLAGLVNTLEAQPSLDNETLKVITSAKKVSGSSHSTSSSTSSSNTIPSSTFQPLLQLIPRTIQSNLMHGENQHILFEGLFWEKISSKTDFVKSANRYWVSVGSSQSRENIFFDSQSSKMVQLERQALMQASNESGVSKILQVVNTIISQLPIQANLRDVRGYTNVHLDELIDKGQLVCRHKSLIAVKLVSSLIEKMQIPSGSVHSYRTNLTERSTPGAHTFTTYRNYSNNELWIIDSTWNRLFNLADSPYPYYQVYSHRCKWLRGAKEYGATAIVDMVKRLNYVDFYAPFVETLNAKVNAHKFPLISTVYTYEEKSPNASIEIRISFSEHTAVKNIEHFAIALARQNLSSRLLSLDPPVLAISTMQPAFFGPFDFDKLELTFANLQVKKARQVRSTTPYYPYTAIKNQVQAALRVNFLGAIESNNLTMVNWMIASKLIHGRTQSIGYVNAAKLGHLQIIKAHLHARTIGVSQEALIIAAGYNQVSVFSHLFSILEEELPLSLIVTLLNIAIDKNYLEIFLKISTTTPASRMTNQVINNIFTRAIKRNCQEIVIHLHACYFHHFCVSDRNTLRVLATTERNNTILKLLGPMEPMLTSSLSIRPLVPSNHLTATGRVLTFSYQPSIFSAPATTDANLLSVIQNQTRPTP